MLLLAACTAEDGKNPADTDADPTGDTSGTDELEAPPTPSADWCDRLLGGPAGGELLPDLATAHATERLFGFDGGWQVVDQALIDVLGGDEPDLAAYAAALAGVCHVAPLALEEAYGGVVWSGTTAVIQPGPGLVDIPQAPAYALDLRGLPAGEALEGYLAAALEPLLPADLNRPRHRVREYDGFPDQFFSSSNVYSVGRGAYDPPSWIGAGGDVPLAVLTDDRLAPLAAELAFTLRVGGHAWLVGEDVLALVAESTWAPVADEGLVIRTHTLLDGDGTWPDQLDADWRVADPVAAVADLESWGSAPAAARPQATRSELPGLDPWDEEVAPVLGLAESRAGLLIVHGVLRRFYPYFHVVGDGIDERLAEVWPQASADREAYTRLLGRLGNVLSDGHMFVWNIQEQSAEGCMNLMFDQLGGEIVIESSLLPDILPGDVLLSMEGVAASTLLADALTYRGGATPGYAFNVAMRVFIDMNGPRTLLVAAPDGTQRSVTIEPASCSEYYDLPWGHTNREAGWLTEDVYYLNLDGGAPDVKEWSSNLDEARKGAGLVLDMRGYPGVNHYEVAKALFDTSFVSATFRVPLWTGPAQLEITESSYAFTGDGSYVGPVVVLTGPRAVSAAENFLMMLHDRVTFLGRSTAGTNGNITAIKLPGEFVLSFTGMEVLNPDGSTLHGVGIVPDVEVIPTRADWAAGVDPELEAAIALLKGG